MNCLLPVICCSDRERHGEEVDGAERGGGRRGSGSSARLRQVLRLKAAETRGRFPGPGLQAGSVPAGTESLVLG